MARKCADVLPGGLAAGRCPSDFDAGELAAGTRVELEHTGNRRIAREIAMDHLAEDHKYYRKLAKMEGKKYGSNRRRVYDAETIAVEMRETFHWSKVKAQYEFDFNWPQHMQHVGDSLAVSYSSDKGGKAGDMKPWKHLAESRNVALCIPGLIHNYDRPKEKVNVIGPIIDMTSVPLPKHFARLALFEELYLRLHTAGTDRTPRLGKGDKGIVQLTVKHGYLGGSKIRWSQVGQGKDQPFLFVYTERDGILIAVVGKELDIERDGIVG